MRVAPAMPTGIADVNGRGQIVVGTVIARRDADPAAVIAGVKQVIDRERARLPQGANLGVLYDRSELTGRIEQTLRRGWTIPTSCGSSAPSIWGSVSGGRST